MSEIHAQKPVLTNEVLEDVHDEDFVFVQQDKKLVDETYAATSSARDIWLHFKKE